MLTDSHLPPFLFSIRLLFPTSSYALDNFDVSKIVTSEAVADKTKKVKAQRKVRTVLQQRYNAGTNKWFFTRLSF